MHARGPRTINGPNRPICSVRSAPNVVRVLRERLWLRSRRDGANVNWPRKFHLGTPAVGLPAPPSCCRPATAKPCVTFVYDADGVIGLVRERFRGPLFWRSHATK
jgi:hypothetical protein